MARKYNQINVLRRYKLVIDIVQKHYVEGITSYKGIWREYVYPVYPMSYNTFMQIMNTPNVAGRLRELEELEAKKGKKQP
jgi:hypothetical protein